MTYWTKFTIQNNSTEKVVIKPEDITCIFREADAEETLYFKRKELVAEPGRTADYNGSQESFWKQRKMCRKRTAPALMNCVYATMAKPLCSSMGTTAKT